jgi:hypothetical protein
MIVTATPNSTALYAMDGSKHATVAVGDTVAVRAYARFAEGDSSDTDAFDKTWLARQPGVAQPRGGLRGGIVGVAPGITWILVSIAGFTDSMTVTVR